MRNLGKFSATVILTLSLTLSIYAGHIPCGVTDEPIPAEVSVTGETENTVEPTDTATEAVVSLIETMLMLF